MIRMTSVYEWLLVNGQGLFSWHWMNHQEHFNGTMISLDSHTLQQKHFDWLEGHFHVFAFYSVNITITLKTLYIVLYVERALSGVQADHSCHLNHILWTTLIFSTVWNFIMKEKLCNKNERN